jgi:hypothetical protein
MKHHTGLILQFYGYFISETTRFRKPFWLLIRG